MPSLLVNYAIVLTGDHYIALCSYNRTESYLGLGEVAEGSGSPALLVWVSEALDLDLV